jgi:hypothetical protein
MSEPRSLPAVFRERRAAFSLLFLAASALSCSRKNEAKVAALTASASAAASVAPSSSADASESSDAIPTSEVVDVPHGPLAWLAIGGGYGPESSEVSLEQDIALVQKALPGPGLVLFGGGSRSLSVREFTTSDREDALLTTLGDVLHPRPTRGSRYRQPRFRAEKATLDNVEARLDLALSSGTAPLLVYIAAHGDQGDRPSTNSVAFWGNQTLNVETFARIHGRHERPMRVVMTSCFSGGFADLVFEQADEKRGASKVLRCGVFAGPWDRETSGCDPNPDRRAQESYGIRFLQALRRKDGSGKELTIPDVDFDGDGKVGLLDAHTHARITALSFDLPTTTSERYLRKVERGSAPLNARALPEDWAVIERLGKALSLPTEDAAKARWEVLDKELADVEKALDDHDAELGKRSTALADKLLERWPVLDDAYDPSFAGTVARRRADIAEVLEHSDEAAAREEAKAAIDADEERRATLEVDEARVSRLIRAYETLHRASALVRRGGKDLARYQSLLACERGAP